MGVTGSGKSSFISLLADQDVEVSHSLRSNTVNVKAYSFTDDSGRTVFLVDTPGFDDTARSDAEILKDISYFLAAMYANRIRLAGLIYLHRISDARMLGSAVKNLSVFKNLCGESAFGHVVLATTMWSEMERNGEADVAHQRLSELQSTYWADMIELGSMVARHIGQRSSAREMVRMLMERATSSLVTLDIQRQLVDEGKTLAETEAGKLILADISATRKNYDRERAELQESLDEAQREEDEEGTESIISELSAIGARARQRHDDGISLGVNIRQLAEEQHPRYLNLITTLQQDSTDAGSSGPAPDPRSEDLDARVRYLERRLKEKDDEVAEMHKRQQHQSRRSEAKRDRGYPYTVERRPINKVEDGKQDQNVVTQLLTKIGSFLGVSDEKEKEKGRLVLVRNNSTPSSMSDAEHR
ncbi:hypothetical protein PV08_01274 [Exophiala spinifera]|uniref:G domain-containing protein n=1 Tax=Exophiala spinifera TaxID=91928 RepID=A0A0D2A7E7_9EURO|nr:uncharacterized protein PV08_01274 [Exophiala spinifera]KIW20697.1 hypothetical protein PV08_01274 [Exophiala spinifera]